MGKEKLLSKNIKFNDLFDLKALNVPKKKKNFGMLL